MELPRKRLFILGAGFSKPGGLPLGKELLAEVREVVRTEFQRYGWDGPLEKEILEWQTLYPTEDLSLEAVLAYSHRIHYLQLIGSDEYFDHGSRTIVAARTAIQRILSRTVAAPARPLYADFASRLSPDDVVFTFNYDTVLEDTLDELGKQYSLVPEWWLDRSLQDDRSDQYIDILKLHGSIDWYDRKYYEDTRKYFDRQPVAVPDRDPLFGPNATIPIEPLYRGALGDGTPTNLVERVVRVPEHRKYFPVENGSYTTVPFLLPPAYDKLLGHDPIRDIWRDMHRTGDAFCAIVVIGYSMPVYDAYAYEAIGRLLAVYQSGGPRTLFDQRRAPLQYITLSQNEEEVYRTLPLLKRSETRIWTRGFNADALKWLDWGDE